MRFTAVSGGCEVHLVQGGWSARGGDAAAIRGNHKQGWRFVLACHLATGAAKETT